MRIFLGIVIVGVVAWTVVAVYRTVSCARFSRALRAEATRSGAPAALPIPLRAGAAARQPVPSHPERQSA
jgi:hypothetical protein